MSDVKLLRMLRNIAVGDALGAGYEFTDPERTHGVTLSMGFQPHPKRRHKAGRPTDDTLLSVALTRALCCWLSQAARQRRQKQEALPPSVLGGMLADEMVGLHRQYPSPWLSDNMQHALDFSDKGADLLWFFQQEGRRKASNGAAMRAAPLGVVATPELAAELAVAQALITHCDEGVEAARVVALASWHFVHGGTKAGLVPFLVSHQVGRRWFSLYSGRVQQWHNGAPLGEITVRAVLTLLGRCTTLTQVLEGAIRLGGDTNTTAAIAMALAGSCADYADDLPSHVLEGVVPVGSVDLPLLAALDERLTLILAGRWPLESVAVA